MVHSVKLIMFSLVVATAHSCGDSNQPPENFPSQKEVNKSLETINRKFVLDEAMMIDAYIERRNLEMKTTGTGLRYKIFDEGAGELATNGQYATAYDSSEDGQKEFLIGQDYVESGLHEGILMMRKGDRAKFILPSHLAHGLSGDNNKIPPRSSVVYDIRLISLRS
jgi:FKBP-type peptidyl-prolyl cis-trans isomerase FkpA